MFWLLVCIAIGSLLFYRGLKLLNYLDNVAGMMEMIPGPTPYPFVGNLFQFGLRAEEYPKKILQYCRKYEFQGFRSLVFFQYHVMLSDPKEIEKILSSPSLLYKEHLYSFLRPWLGDGLLTTSGARWLKHRKIYLPAFERPAIEGYLQVVQRTTTATGGQFMKELNERASNGGLDIFDVQAVVRKCVLDITCEIATGVGRNHGDDGVNKMQEAINDLCDIIQQRAFSIVKRYDTLFQLTASYWHQRQALSSLKREVHRIIQHRCAQLQNDDPQVHQQPRPFLDVLLNARLDREPLKFKDIFEELSTFIYTGFEPVASAVSFTLYTLSRHPEIQQKVFEEQRKIFQSSKTEVRIEQLQQMQYLESVIQETLRLYPAVPLIARTNRKAIDISGTRIAKRTTVIMCLIAMGYNEKYFPDPCVFRPERFGPTENSSKRKSIVESFQSVPFSAGPRGCVASVFAMYELKAIISAVVRDFVILPARQGLPPGINDHSHKNCQPESVFDPVLNIRMTLKSENGIQIRLKRREE